MLLVRACNCVLLQVHSGKVKSESLQELSGQFRGLILGYDEVSHYYLVHLETVSDII